MWPFRKKNKPKPLPPSASYLVPRPVRSHNKDDARKVLREAISAYASSQREHNALFESIGKCKGIEANKERVDFLLRFIAENRKLVDTIEVCLLILVSDLHQMDSRRNFRAYMERVLEEFQSL